MGIFEGSREIPIHRIDRKPAEKSSYVLLRRGLTPDKVILDFGHHEYEVDRESLRDGCNSIWKDQT